MADGRLFSVERRLISDLWPRAMLTLSVLCSKSLPVSRKMEPVYRLGLGLALLSPFHITNNEALFKGIP